MAAPKIKIDGVEYEVPESIKLGEARIIERYCEGHSGSDGYGIAQTAGLIHVAILRKRPGTSFEEIQKVVDELDIDELNNLMQPLEDDAGPPESEQRPDAGDEPSSPSSVNGSVDALESAIRSSTGPQDSPTGSGSFRQISVS